MTLSGFFFPRSFFPIEFAEEFGEVVDFDLLFLSFGVSEIVEAGGTFGEKNFSSCIFDDLT